MKAKILLISQTPNELQRTLSSPNYELRTSEFNLKILQEIFENEYELVVIDFETSHEITSVIKDTRTDHYTPVIFINQQESSTILKQKIETLVLQSNHDQREINRIYDLFNEVFSKMVDPIWCVLLNAQLLKRLTQKDRERVMQILNKNLDHLENAGYEINRLMSSYKSQLEKHLY